MRRPHRLGLSLAAAAVVVALWAVGPRRAAEGPAPIVSGSAFGPAATRELAREASHCDGCDRPLLLALQAPGSPEIDLAGFDPGAPRDLVVWRVSAGSDPRPVARTRSAPDGRFVVSGVPASAAGGRVLALAEGETPAEADWQGTPQLGRTAAARPIAWLEQGQLVVALRRESQRVLLADASGVELASLTLPRSPRRGATWRRPLDELTEPVAWIAAVRPDARGAPRDWQRVRTSSRPDRSIVLKEHP